MTSDNPNETETDLARAIAADLGPDVLAAIEAPQPEDATRALGIPEAMAIGGFLVSAAQFAFTVWQARKAENKQAEFVADLLGNKQLHAIYPSLPQDKRMGVMDRIARKLAPDTFGTGADARKASLAQRQRWIADYIEHRRQKAGAAPAGVSTRDFIGGATILVPFADQMNWIVWQPIGWLPDETDGPGVVRVDVPKGFVTDLATIPSYLWAILQKTGRYGNAAIYHDWLCWQQTCTRKEADDTFERAMKDMGVDATTRNLIWAGVRVFGGSYWDDNTAEKAAGGKRVLKVFPEDPAITWEEWRARPGVFDDDDED